MKKSKKFKGFTLIECIVAMAVLAIASLVMVQIYSTIAKINSKNHRFNESLSQTVASVEKQSEDDTGAFVKLNNQSNTKIEFVKVGTHYNETADEYTIDQKYTSVYVYYSEDSEAYGSTRYTDADTDPIGMRYKYFLYEPPTT